MQLCANTASIGLRVRELAACSNACREWQGSPECSVSRPLMCKSAPTVARQPALPPGSTTGRQLVDLADSAAEGTDDAVRLSSGLFHPLSWHDWSG